MKITLNNSEYPLYDIEDVSSADLNELISFFYKESLPVELSVSLAGCLYRFKTAREREQFALGLQAMWDILTD